MSVASKITTVLKKGSNPSAPALFLLPTFAGTTACYNEMLKYLSAFECDVVGITDPYLSGDREVHFQSYEAWMGVYADAIQAKQPEGPYRVCGYSQGAAYAYSVAVILKQRGATVDACIMLDAIFNPWDRATLALDYFAAFMTKEQMPPCCCVCLVRSLLNVLVAGFGINSKTNTRAEKQVAFAKMTSLMSKDPDKANTFAVYTELDTGVKMTEGVNEWKQYKQKGFEDPAAMYCAKMAEKFEGVSAQYVKDVMFVSSIAVLRGKDHTAPKCPSDVPVYHISPQRGGPNCSLAKLSGMYDLAPHLTEITVTLPPLIPSMPCSKLGANDKGNEQHYRCMHDKSFFDKVQEVMKNNIGGILA